MDKITEILKEMHEMQDEPVRMQEGGTVDDTRLGNLLTPEEYQQRFIDYYAFPGIGVEAAPPADTEEEEDEPVRPDILRPVGERGEGAPNIFRQVPIGTGPVYDVSDVDPNEYIANFGKNESYTADTGGFKGYLERGAKAIKDRGLLPAGVVSLTGLPVGAMAFGAAQLNKKQQMKNATAISQAGGNAGSMFTLNGQTVSRAPGSTRFDGTIVGMSNEQLYRLDEIRNKFIPGTMKEVASSRPDMAGVYTRTGKEALSTAGDVAIDAFGTVHGAGGPQMVGALQAERAREQMFRDAMKGRNLAGINVSSAALSMKQALDAEMSGSKSFFTTTARMSDADYNKALTRSQQFIQNYVSKNYGSEEEAPAAPTVTVTQQKPSETPQSEAAAKSDDSGGGGGGTSYSVGGGGVKSSVREAIADAASRDESVYSGGGRFGGFRQGGRVGMQMGGAAAQPAGFVGGPPENFTDGQTVADDQPMTVPEGTFVINAAAVEFAGSDDIKKMLSDAYGKMQKKVDKTIGVAKIPTEDEIDVAVSRGEVIVPPEVAKIIGYDRLEKINNRGKKEVSRRQEAAGGGFLDGKKFAEGGEAPKTLPERKPRRGELADVELRADLEEFIKDDQLARLGWDLYTSRDLKLIGTPMQRGTKSYTASGIFLPREGEDTFPVYPKDVGYSEEQEKERGRVIGPATAGRAVEFLSGKLGRVLDPKAPTALYLAEPGFIRKEIRTTEATRDDRAQVMITLAHELRHAALNHMKFEYGAPEMTLGGEESLMDYFDEKARRTASKKNALVSAIPLTKGREKRYKAARLSSYNKDMYEMYNELATEILKERGVPTIAPPEEKGFITKFMDKLFREPHPATGTLKKGDGKPTDYESEAYIP